MSNPWTAEMELSPGDAAKLITDQFPELTPIHINLLGQGFDNTVFMVNDRYVFRFPRRNMAEALLKTENLLLPRLVEVLPLPIPEPVFFGRSCPEYPWLFTGYKVVPGMIPVSLTNTQREQSAVTIARFLKALHQIPIHTAKNLNVPNDELNRLSIELRKTKLEENVEKAIQIGLIRKIKPLKEYLAQLQLVKAGPEQVLVHGDLHFRNILVNETGVISGIIDWGDVHIGHPAVDLSFAFSFLPPEGRKEFFKAYGQVDESTKYLARFKAVYTSVLLLRYAHDQRDQGFIEGALQALNFALSD